MHVVCYRVKYFYIEFQIPCLDLFNLFKVTVLHTQGEEQRGR